MNRSSFLRLRTPLCEYTGDFIRPPRARIFIRSVRSMSPGHHTGSGGSDTGQTSRCSVRPGSDRGIDCITGLCTADRCWAIELGGEDAKIIYFEGGNVEQRMNGVCAEGYRLLYRSDGFSSADQMPSGLNEYAKHYQALYSIAARCGVFAKSDIQPLINEGLPKRICLPRFSGSCQSDDQRTCLWKPIRGHVAFLGRTTSLLSELEPLSSALKLDDEHIYRPNHSHLFAAIGSALNSKKIRRLPWHIANVWQSKSRWNLKWSVWNRCLHQRKNTRTSPSGMQNTMCRLPIWPSYRGKGFPGIDAGSTTTKAALVGEDGTLLYSFYHNNEGRPFRHNDLRNQRYLQPAPGRCRDRPLLLHRLRRGH